MRHLKKIVCLVFIILCVIVGVVYAAKHHTTARKQPRPQALTVTLAPVTVTPKQQRFTTIGTIKSDKAIDVASEANGIIEKIDFDSGGNVSKDALLVVLKHKKQEAALEKAQAQYASIDDQYQRYDQLFKKKMVATTTLMDLRFKRKEAKAELDLAKEAYRQCFIKAPFSGKLGLRAVSIGQYIHAGDAIINLQSLSPLYVDFSVPEYLGNQLTQHSMIKVISQKGSGLFFRAELVAKDSHVNASTRTLAIRAQIKHPDASLKPGSYTKVHIIIPSKKYVMVVPTIAVDYEPYGATVYTVQKGHAKLTYIQTDEMLNNQMVIKSGLQVGDQVVIAGQNKLHDGALVNVESKKCKKPIS